jgi:two-component system, chemotaxis family, protein-glutamate methylesterase/glutaminase
MAKRDIIVVGASAGGVTALTDFVKLLPQNFGGSIFIVLHISSHSPSNLPAILSRAGLLKACHPSDGEVMKPGTIYIAPPDHHILLDRKCILVKKGPRENRFRPSIDALFRSAAYVFRQRVIGVVLSGLLNDGTSGLWSVKRMGGIGIIQDPDDAQFPSMPANALEYVDADYILPVSEMGPVLSKLMSRTIKKSLILRKREAELMKMEVIIAKEDNAFEMGIMKMGGLTPFTCPECHGVLVRLIEGKIVRFRCHTGHAFTASALLAELTTSVEEKMWQAMRGLEETTMLLKQIGVHLKEQGHKDHSAMFIKKSDVAASKAQIIHDSIFEQELLSEDLRYEKRADKGKKKMIPTKKPKKSRNG